MKLKFIMWALHFYNQSKRFTGVNKNVGYKDVYLETSYYHDILEEQYVHHFEACVLVRCCVRSIPDASMTCFGKVRMLKEPLTKFSLHAISVFLHMKANTSIS
jgi:hypothetical protein